MLRRIVSTLFILVVITGLLSVKSKIQNVKASGVTLAIVNPSTGGNNFMFSPTTPVNSTFTANVTVIDVSLLAAWQINIRWDPELLRISSTADIIIPSDNVFGGYTDPAGLSITDSSVFWGCTIRLGAPFDCVNITYGTLCQIKFTIIKNDTEPLSCNIHFQQQSENLLYSMLVDVNANLIPHASQDGTYEMFPPGTIIVPKDYPTIQEAIDHANEGDTIFVRNGIYFENVVINKTLSLFGLATGTTVVDGGGVGNVVEVTVDNVTIKGFTIRQSGETATVPPDSGIALNHVRNCSISKNTIETNSAGIWFENSSNNNVYENNIGNNGIGIWLWGSSNNVVFENVMTNNNYGLYLELSSNNSIYENAIIGHDRCGIFLSNSSNVISKNNIESNALGILLFHSSNNNVFHNNFVENPQHARAYEAYENLWDHSYPSGGNYWGDYTGVDLYDGQYQNETGSDGIRDTQYIIGENNTDRYPLMKPYPWALHDLGITSVVASKTVVEKGLGVNISITIFNYGNYTENFNVTVYANTTAIRTEIVTLTSRSSTTITFTWNTSAFARAYVISANETPVEGETDTEDNTFVYGIVKVSCLGDINGDYVTNMLDYQLVKIAIPSTPGSPKWNPNADMDDNLVVNMLDFQIVKGHIPSLLPP